MSGHSKWSSIKHKKGAADAKRGKLFSKLSRAIIVAAKEGGRDPDNNLSLQNAIEKARSYSMPKDNIDRAIAKGAGTGADAADFESIVYEGFGPERRGRDRRGADRQPQPHRLRRPPHVREERRQPRRRRRRRVAVRAARHRARRRRRRRRGRADAGRRRGRRRGRLLDGSTFQVTSEPESLARGARGDRGRRVHGRVGGADDGAEDDRRGRGRELRRRRSCASSTSSRTTTTSRRSTRTSTSPSSVLEAVAS